MTIPAPGRELIVNADDLGLSPGTNRGILAAHRGGIVTSASLLVRFPAAAEAASLPRSCPELSLGLHVDLGEWYYRQGSWFPLYEVVPTGDVDAVRTEVARQLDAFRCLIGRDPTHLDSHQHVHRNEPVRSILAGFARGLCIPLRDQSPEVGYWGGFYGQTPTGAPLPEAISVAALIGALAALPEGCTELGCHPGLDEDLAGMYRRERAVEVSSLCDPRVRAAIVSAGIRLRSFRRDDPRPARAFEDVSRV